MFHRWVGALVGLVLLGGAGPVNATLINFDIIYSTVGTGSFIYDDVGLNVTAIEYDFGAFGSFTSSGISVAQTATIFGNPPSDFFIAPSFANLIVGTALGVAYDPVGNFCLTGVGGASNFDCFQGNFVVLSGSYQFVAVPEPATIALFGIGLAGLGFMTRRRKRRQT